MPVTHRASIAATTAIRGRRVAWKTGAAIGVLAAGDDGLRRRISRRDAFDDDRFVARGRHEVEFLGRERFNAARRLQRLDLELQLTAGFLFRGLLTLHLLDLVPVAEQFEVLPR